MSTTWGSSFVGNLDEIGCELQLQSRFFVFLGLFENASGAVKNGFQTEFEGN
jgi:hypothetical protein